MMNPQPQTQPTGERITLDQALAAAQDAIKGETNFSVKEIMEFENNFYVLVTEKESGRGAMEPLVNPLSGAVFPEHGPNHMWNSKYGMRMHASTTAGENSISLPDAQTKAQAALDKEVTGATVNADGTRFLWVLYL